CPRRSPSCGRRWADDASPRSKTRLASRCDQDDAGERDEDAGVLRPLYALPEDDPCEQHRDDWIERREHRDDAQQATRRRGRREESVSARVEDADREESGPV